MKSLMIAGTRPGPPQMPVRNRNGTSIRSKKIDEQREVLGHERAEHAALREAEPEEEQPRPLGSRVNAASSAREEQHGRVQDEEEVQPVDAELVVDPELADPRLVGDELQARPRSEADEHAIA